MPWKESTMINERTAFALSSLQEGVNFSALCARYGISRKTGYKWRERFLEDGAQAMGDLSRRPRHSPEQLCEEVLLRINRLHQRHPQWGPKKIQALYLRAHRSAPSLSSFKRVFERSGWVQKRPRRRSSEAGRICHGRKGRRPNEVWTVDFKGWWHTGDGHRCEPLTIRDEATRYLLEVRAMRSASTEAVRAVFEAVFTRYGLPQVIRSDNGPPFAARSRVLGLSRLSAWWVALGIDLERGRPGKPQDNGGHERMHRDIQGELQANAAEDQSQQQAAFEIWRKTFNEERPHEALGMRMPAEVYTKSPRRFRETPTDLAYPGMLTRRVQRSGQLRINGQLIQLSSALAGWSVGLKHLEQDRYEVFFAQLRLGEIELQSAAFVGAASGPDETSLPPQQNIS